MTTANIARALLVIFLLLIFLKPAADPDFGWHLSQGEWMLNNQRILRQDILTWTFAGTPWSDFYWLTEVGMAAIYRFIGLNALSILFSGLVSAMFLFSVRRIKFDIFSYLAVLAGAVLVSGFSGIRPQVISWAYFLLLFYLLNRFNLIRIFYLPLLFVLWANTHISFILGLGLLSAYIVIEIIDLFRQKKTHLSLSDTQTILKLLSAGILSLLATLVNPYGISLWRTVLLTINSPLDRNNIMEYASANFHTPFSWLYLVWFVLWFWATKGFKEDSKRCLLIMFLFLLGLYAVRFMPLFILLTLPQVISSVSLFEHNQLMRMVKKGRVLTLGRIYLAVFTIVICLQMVVTTVWDLNSDGQIAKTREYPKDAIVWLKNNYNGERLFSLYDWGGYISWKAPQAKVFINGRMPSWKKDSRNIFADYLTLVQLKPGWQEIIDNYKIDMILIKKDMPLAQILQSYSWEIVYQQENQVVFKKN